MCVCVWALQALCLIKVKQPQALQSWTRCRAARSSLAYFAANCAFTSHHQRGRSLLLHYRQAVARTQHAFAMLHLATCTLQRAAATYRFNNGKPNPTLDEVRGSVVVLRNNPGLLWVVLLGVLRAIVMACCCRRMPMPLQASQPY